jgi:hypothetical protein
MRATRALFLVEGGQAVKDRIVQIFDRLLELYYCRREAERRKNTDKLRSLEAEIRKLEAVVADVRTRRRAPFH